MKPLNWGILGASYFARNRMAPAIHAAEGARVHALATSDPANVEGFRAFCPDILYHSSYEALLADPAIDVVYIPLPNALHVEWTLKALAAGKHVLTEKPIAMRADEIDTLIAARDRAGLLAAEAYMIVHHPQWQRTRQLVADGAIGALRHVDVGFSFDNGADAGNIRNRPETGGGGLRDIGVYAFGCTRFVSGQEPVRLVSRIRRENDVDVFVQVMADFPDFTYGAMVSMRLHPRQEVVLQGETGVIRLTAPFNAGVFGEAQVHMFRQGKPDVIERFPGARQYKLQVEAFCRSVQDGAPFAWTLEDARGTQAMIDMAFAADRPI